MISINLWILAKPEKPNCTITANTNQINFSRNAMQQFDRSFGACKQTLMNNIIDSFGNLLQNNIAVQTLRKACKIVVFNCCLMPEYLMDFSANRYENLTSVYFNK